MNAENPSSSLQLSNTQARYWLEVVQVRRNVSYISLHCRRSEAIDRRLDIFAAVCGSGSIGGWAIWSQYHVFWAVIIALSQVLTAIKPHLPYKKRIKSLYKLMYDLEVIALKAEDRWYEITEGRVSQDSIHKYYIDMKNDIKVSVNSSFGENTLPEIKALINKSDQMATEYFQSRWG
ncbi:MAG: hypothetical protein PW843_05290 [Azospirillaceae bacterium]|nr:hypothetical protein [Azospirillaceae bacterium]